MGLPININELLHGRVVEWERIEFKEGWNPEDVLHTMCAFANDFHNLGGGYLIIGVATVDGRPVLPPTGIGINTLDKMQQEILYLGHKMRPDYQPFVELCIVEEKHVLLLRCPGGHNRPYKAPDSLAKTEKAQFYYIRHGSSTVRATQNDEHELISLTAQVPFDDRLNHNASLNDLKPALIQNFLRDVNSNLRDEIDKTDFETLRRKMEIAGGPTEMPLPKNVGLMFFNEEPSKFFRRTQIDVVQFPNGIDRNPIIENTFKGPLAQMLRDALLFLNNSILSEYVIKSNSRAEALRFYNYPYAALEELLVNAVYHRSYEIREPIEVRVLPDRITINSFPGPDASITMASLAKGTAVARRYRNSRIGDFFKDLRLTEGRGTGIPTAIRAMKENGSPAPTFDTNEDRSYFTATLPIHLGAVLQNTPQVKPNTPQVTPQVKPNTPQVGDADDTQPSLFEEYAGLKMRERIMLAFCESPRDRASIQARLGLKDPQHFRERYLYSMLNRELVTMTDPEHPNSPQQKYRTTEAGMRALEATE